MSEKQLTVAELLAKAGKEEPSGSSRRRRRRSIEEGGVSVAELTGNIPKVDAKPAESKHSSEPIDPEPVEPTVEDSASDAPVTTPDGAGVEANKAEKVEEKADSSSKSTPVEPFQEQRDDAAEPEDALEQDASEEETHEDEAADDAEDAANIVISVVSADEPLRLTTGAFRAQLPEKAESAREDATVVLPAVEDEEMLALASLGAAAADEADEDYEEDYETEEDFDEAYDEQLAEEEYDEYEEYDDELVDEDAADYDDDVEYEEVESDYEDIDEAEAEYALEEAAEADEEKMSIVAVAAMALVGIILGVALFTGFQYLWSTMSKTTVGLIALGVTAALVVLVKLLRTSRDGVSMFLAGIVGLVMTFGPLLVVGF
ncbi:hypothetical protein P4N68_02595 [Corynebacterium felinum]|uniref:Chemotaxis protein histidine kinase CheA n=1 Tax=Corynebacterium felinum TaxID=131318 RepID=A0ABU2B7F3_9CORY|nr:hypothetical protein [Corynebacterium felinum]MDF5819972.1 hypothetical protein [Corynebacterium felinum]MDR7354541.1 chemotaxis protein histidine kinase CheA [Corynebacterium felinum]WJY93908.1 hypothetical protein CFELI_01300 [Corynebacterium felinum]